MRNGSLFVLYAEHAGNTEPGFCPVCFRELRHDKNVREFHVRGFRDIFRGNKVHRNSGRRTIDGRLKSDHHCFMPSLSLHLPILQNWSCHNCGGCCRDHAVTITAEEQTRILSQKWTPANGIPENQPLFVEERRGLIGKEIRLAHQPDGACVFLDSHGLCRIHARFGEAAKPLACRIYPYAFHPCGDGLTVSLRFSCPSVAANRGTPLARQKRELKQLAELVVPANYRGAPPPRLTPRTQLDWEETLSVVEALDQTYADPEFPLAVKILQSLYWSQLVAQAKLRKIRGERLLELLELLVNAARIEIPELPAKSPPPSSIGMTQFRLLAGQYARKDTAASIDLSWRGRFQQFKNALQLARRNGTLPALQPGLAEMPVTALDAVSVQFSSASEEMFTRYFRVKLQGFHFCGAACYGQPVIEGYHALTLVYPVSVWLARWRAASAGRQIANHDDLQAALMLVDHQHAYSPALGHWPARRRVRNFATSGDLPRLITWAGELCTKS